MRIEPLVPDMPITAHPATPNANGFSKVLDDIGAILDGAQSAENVFAEGHGSLSNAIYERARADVVLSVATTAVQRTAQGLQSILNMQV